MAMARNMLVLSALGSRTARATEFIDDSPNDSISIATLTTPINCKIDTLCAYFSTNQHRTHNIQSVHIILEIIDELQHYFGIDS